MCIFAREVGGEASCVFFYLTACQQHLFPCIVALPGFFYLTARQQHLSPSVVAPPGWVAAPFSHFLGHILRRLALWFPVLQLNYNFRSAYTFNFILQFPLLS